MKLTNIMLCAAAVFLVACNTVPLALSTVGPNPTDVASDDPTGQLQVFSSLMGMSEGGNPTWFQHSDYYIYNAQNNLVKHVNNSTGHYEEAPRLLTLPAGKYTVKAQAKDYFWVTVPVMVEAGKTTSVHLDDNWNAPQETSRKKLVYTPNGYPLGWAVNYTNEVNN